MQHPEDVYSHHIERYTQDLDKIKSRLLLTSMLRLGGFIIFILSVYYLYLGYSTPWVYLLAGSLLLFVLLLRRFSNLKFQKSLLEKLIFLNTNEKNVLAGKSNSFDAGNQYLDQSLYASDLDVFGPGSIFHHINRTTTENGANELASLLNDPHTQVTDILEFQGAVKILAPQVETRQLIKAHGLLHENSTGSLGEVHSWLQTPSRLLHLRWLRWIRFVLPLFTIAAFFYYLDSDNPLPLGAGIILNWMIIITFGKYIHAQHVMIGRKERLLEQYAAILNSFSKTDPGSSSLLQSLFSNADAGRKQVRSLSQLSAVFDQRLNLLVNLFLNSILMYDVHCMLALEKWKEKNRTGFKEWIETAGRIEMVNSLATFAFNHPRYTYPQVYAGAPAISAKKMSHPLIPENESVPNDLEAGVTEKFVLITGSNMSGKSTFLRTIGTNVLLAQCGLPVCAVEFRWTPMKILSSIRINDSLQEHTSYFMAELKRLRSIIEVLQAGQPALVLIDEVLRGTNSNDKTHGSESLIRKLISNNALVFFATHDLSLSTLERELDGKLSNYCFESNIENGELYFDYKLHRGVARNKNATFLMEKMGII